ncbi:hypothetical protein [Roseiflexus sp.]|uniref:hypothetical protein n=1 Tax=Roseiflexus sp. TaxID=2562120 RepID=UPI0021DD7D38|nr:hypothetical protein [Roseiflexus sp.]GIW01680.1 MAG: hypothetical protein KatS3mg058_3083 [Roseiflexus sp.]
MSAIRMFQSVGCPFCRSKRAIHALANVLPAFGSIVVVIALPLLCILHCHAATHHLPDSSVAQVMFICPMLLEPAGIAVTSAEMHRFSGATMTLRAFYESVAASALMILFLALLIRRVANLTLNYTSFPDSPPSPPPRRLLSLRPIFLYNR